jgi:Rne/Rng family ribonuclease
LMPGSNHVAVSKKIVDRDERDRLKGILADLAPPENLGYVIRTEGVNSNAEQLGADLTYLLRTWRRLSERIGKAQAPSLVYREYEWPTRQLREFLSRDVEEVVSDDPELHARLQVLVRILEPGFQGRVTLHDSPRPLLASHGVNAR